jgi:hypothetical protein
MGQSRMGQTKDGGNRKEEGMGRGAAQGGNSRIKGGRIKDR